MPDEKTKVPRIPTPWCECAPRGQPSQLCDRTWTSQVALPRDISEMVCALSEYKGSSSNLSRVSLNSDNVFGDDGGSRRPGASRSP